MPINFDINEIKDDCNVYFETGLWNVKTDETSLCKAIKMDFDKVCSVDINSEFIENANSKFQKEVKEGRLKLFHGDSKELNKYLDELNLKDERILFFLDSHGGDCPLMEELYAIEKLAKNGRKDHTILIDDIRIIRSCIWGDTRYDSRTFEDKLKNKILDINPDYQFSYLNGYQKDDVLMARIVKS